MATGKDKSGRMRVVVTGLGVVTSLGAGKTDNWAKLTARLRSGIKTITRFPTDGLKHAHSGHDRLSSARSSNAALTESFAELAAEEAIAQSDWLAPANSLARSSSLCPDRDGMAATANSALIRRER